MTYTAYIWSFAQFYLTLRPWPSTFDLGGVWWIKSLTHQTHIPIFSTLRLSIPELCVTQSDHITITWNGHCACAVSRDLSPGRGNDPHFWNPWPQFTYSLCHFQGATTKIKLCYVRKIAFSHCEGYKVHCACAVSRDPCIGVPKTTRNNFLTPYCLFTIQCLWRYDDD